MLPGFESPLKLVPEIVYRIQLQWDLDFQGHVAVSTWIPKVGKCENFQEQHLAPTSDADNYQKGAGQQC